VQRQRAGLVIAVYLRYLAEEIATGALVLFCTIGLPLAVSRGYRFYQDWRTARKIASVQAYIAAELQGGRR
jgi:hypothetical protein